MRHKKTPQISYVRGNQKIAATQVLLKKIEMRQMNLEKNQGRQKYGHWDFLKCALFVSIPDRQG